MDGKDYHFVLTDTFLKLIQAQELIEYTRFSGNFYGTSKQAVKDVQDEGKICILDLEMEGVKNLKKSDLNPSFVFIRPPGSNFEEMIAVLRQRLKGRGTETDEEIERRLSLAREQLLYGSIPSNFDTVIITDNKDSSYENLRRYVISKIGKLEK